MMGRRRCRERFFAENVYAVSLILVRQEKLVCEVKNKKTDLLLHHSLKERKDTRQEDNGFSREFGTQDRWSARTNLKGLHTDPLKKVR